MARIGEAAGLPDAALPRTGGATATWGPLLHRWGAAFPCGRQFTAEPVAPASRVAFAGDYIQTDARVRIGSIESALLSGIATAEGLLATVAERGEATLV